MDYLLRPTVIAGNQLKDDYCVFLRDRSIGTIRRAVSGPGKVKDGSGT